MKENISFSQYLTDSHTFRRQPDYLLIYRSNSETAASEILHDLKRWRLFPSGFRVMGINKGQGDVGPTKLLGGGRDE